MNYHEQIISESLKRSIERNKPDIREKIIKDCNMDIQIKRKKPAILKPICAVITLYMIFVFIINIYPVAANSLMQIPIIDKIVWASIFDKGIYSAYVNGYTQPVNESISDNNVTFTVHDIIIGNKINFFISFKIENMTYEKEIKSINISATDQNSKRLSIAHHNTTYDNTNNVYINGFDVFSCKQDVLKDISYINIKITCLNFTDGTRIEGDWEISVPIKTEQVIKETIWQKDINIEVVNNDSTSFVFQKIISTPSDTAIYIAIDAAYAMKNPGGVYIIDDKGNKIYMSNGFAKKSDNDIMIFKYYFESSYPNIPVKIGYFDPDINDVKEIDITKN